MSLLLVESDQIKLRDYLKSLLSEGIHSIVFAKKDGSQRLLNGTRDPNQIGHELYEKYMNPPPKKDGKERMESKTSVPTFDMDINQWRAFSIIDLLEIDGINIDVILKNAQINIEE